MAEAAPAPQGDRAAVAGGGSNGAGPLVQVRDLKVHFADRGTLLRRGGPPVRAVDGVTFEVRRGETLGLVGESGCGKTTVGRTILRLYDPTDGAIVFDGTDIARLSGADLRRLRKRMQMVFQDPYSSLNPRQNVANIVAEPLKVHGVPEGRGMRDVVREVLDAVGLPPGAANRYPHEFSGGQRQRIGLARAIALRPDLVVADEPVSALDVSIQAQIINLLSELQGRYSLTYLFIAHDLAVVRHISDRVAVMYLGTIAEVAPSHELYRQPLHPYTKALLSAVPIPDPQVERTRERIILSGDLPSPANPPSGCRFHTRCPYLQPTRCADEVPVLRQLGAPRAGVGDDAAAHAAGGAAAPDAPTADHTVACHWAEEILAGRIQPRAQDPLATA